MKRGNHPKRVGRSEQSGRRKAKECGPDVGQGWRSQVIVTGAASAEWWSQKRDPQGTLVGQKQKSFIHSSNVQNPWSHNPFTFLNVLKIPMHLGLYELHLSTFINITVLEIINWGIFQTQEYANTRCPRHQREGHFT